MKQKYHHARFALASVAALATGAALHASAADYQATVLSQNPAAYWRLNETPSPIAPVTTAANLGSFGSLDNGTYNGSQGFFRNAVGALSGSSDKAAHFDGSSQGVQVPFDPALNGTNFTVETWVAPDLVGGAVPGGLTCVISCGDFASPRAGWLIYQSTTGFNMRMYNQNALNFSINPAGNTNMVAGTYYHLAATFDGTTANLYVNGTLIASAAWNNTGSVNYVPGTAGPFSIGVRSDNGIFWQGSEDEVAYYTNVLSASTIAAHYAAATTNGAGYSAQILADHPVLYFRLDEPGGTSMSNIGTLGSTAPAEAVYPAVLGAPGPVPSSFPGFDATNTAADFTTGGYVQAKPLNINSLATITGWIRPAGSQPNDAGVIFHRARTSAGGTYGSVAGIKIDAAGGNALSYNWDGDISTYNWASGVSINDSQWNFVALVVSTNQAVLWVPNGPNPSPATNFLNHANLRFEGTTYLGLDPYTNITTTTRAFAGQVDEVAIFPRPLSLGEIYSQYGAAVGNLSPVVFNDPQVPVNPIYAGDPLVLTVDAGGTPGLTYQWRKSLGNVGANSSTYTVASATTDDSGSYDVVVSNSSGSTNSGAAAITVQPQVKPFIVQDVAVTSRTIYTNGAIKINASMAGGGITYQWTRYGTNLSGKTTTSLNIAGVKLTDGGPYALVATSTAGSITSSVVNVTIGNPAAGSYEAVIAADGPVSWYRLDDPVSSPYMLDSMGRWDGFWTNQGAPVTLGASGALVGDANTAAHFDIGSKSWGEVPTLPPPITTGDFGVEMWVRTTNTSATVAVSSERYQYGWKVGSTGTGWQESNGYGDLDRFPERIAPADAIAYGTWTHLFITFTAGTTPSPAGSKTYVNGVWDANGPYVDISRNLNTPLRIGARLFSGSYTFYDGEIDEVALYNKALTDTQIANHYAAALFGSTTPPFFTIVPKSQTIRSNSAVTFTLTGAAKGTLPITYQWLKNGTSISGATTTSLTLAAAYTNGASYALRATSTAGTSNSVPAIVDIIPDGPPFANATNGLVMHLKFDGDLSDASGRGNSGTDFGGTSFNPGRLGSGALHFYTSNSIPDNRYVTIGDKPDLRFSSNVNFSVAYWVKYPAGQTNGDLPFLDTAIGSYGNAGYTFAPSYKQGGWSYSLNGNVALYGPPNSINNGNWHHLLHTFDRTGLALTYLDGALVDSRSAAAAGDLDTGNSVTIGQDPTGTYVEDGSADIDDMAVWRRALTAYEAYSIYYRATNANESFDVPGNVKLNVGLTASGQVEISWRPGASLGTLLQTDTLTNGAPWTPVPNVYVPDVKLAPTNAMKFYKLQLN